MLVERAPPCETRGLLETEARSPCPESRGPNREAEELRGVPDVWRALAFSATVIHCMLINIDGATVR